MNSTEKMHIAGLVLARGGSKGIPLKNLQELDGKPLLVWALDAMLQCRGFQSVWVSSDHDRILDVGSQHGAQTHRRSARTSTDQSSSLEAILEFLESHPEVDVIGLVQCSSPFVETADLDEACRKIVCGFDSVFSVRRSHALRWIPSSDGATVEAANFDPRRRPKRQDWDGDLVENGAFYFSRVHLLKRGLIQGGKISYVEMSQMRSLDIDSPYDLWLANQQVLYCSQSESSNDHAGRSDEVNG